MNMRKYLLAPVAGILSVLVYSQNLYADPGCKDCQRLEGQPGSKTIESLPTATGKLARKVSSKDSYQDGYCMQFASAEDTVDIETMFEDIEASPYAKNLNEFWTAPACNTDMKHHLKVPIMFNTAINAPKSENFPQAVHDYFVEEKNNPQAWLEIVNAKSSDGSTFLDFLQFNLQRNYYSVKPSKDAALRIVDYLCKNGGVYSKYKDSVKCSR